jgi:hypothetical protein
MSGLSKKIRLLVLLGILSLFLMMIVSAVDSTAASTKNNFILSAYSDNYNYAVKATGDNNVYFFDNIQGTVPWTYNFGREIGSVAISSDGDYVAVGGEGGMVFLFDRDGNTVWKKTIGNSFIKSISISRDNKFIDITTYFNQVFYVTLSGKQIDGSTRWAGVPTTIKTAVPTPLPTIIQTASNPITFDNPFIFNNNLIVWIILGAIAIVVLWAITKSHQKTTPSPPPPLYPPAPQTGRIEVETVPYGAKIFMNGAYQGISPLTISNLLPGSYFLEAKLSGYLDDKKKVTMNTGQTVYYFPNLQRIQPRPKPSPQPKPQPRPAPVSPKRSIHDHITQLGKPQAERETAQKELIIIVNTEGKSAIQQIIKELETRPSTIKREIINLLYYLCKEGHDGQKVTEELINALTYSSSDVKWLIIQTLGRLKDKRAQHALEAAVSDSDFLVRYWAIISLKNVQES